MPPKKSKIIKYLIHFLASNEIINLIIIEITIKTTLANNGLCIKPIKIIEYLIKMVNNINIFL